MGSSRDDLSLSDRQGEIPRICIHWRRGSGVWRSVEQRWEKCHLPRREYFTRYARNARSSQQRQLLAHYMIARADFDESLVTSLTAGQLARNWRDSPSPDANRMIGDSWIFSGESVVLRVPSAVVDREHNYLLNPLHADFSMVTLGEPEDFQFDRRLSR